MTDYPINPNTPSEELNQSEENLKKQKRIENLTEFLGIIETARAPQRSKERYTFLSYSTHIAGGEYLPQKMLDEVTKLYFDFALSDIRSIESDLDNPSKVWGVVNHDPLQAGQYYLDYYAKPLQDPAYRSLGEGLIELQAKRWEAGYQYKHASLLYERLGQKEKAEEMKLKPDIPKPDWSLDGPIPDYEYKEDMPIFIDGVKNFLAKFKNFKLMSDAEKEKIVDQIEIEVREQLEKLKTS